MSLRFEPNWNKEKSDYVAKFGSYQNLLNLLTQTDVKFALKVASILYHEGKIGEMIRAALKTGGEVVAVEQGAHQLEAQKDAPGNASVKAFDFNPTKTLHFTLRHYRAGGKTIAFHCYLSQNVRREWAITSISFFEKGVGLQMGQTGGRDFMNQLAKNFIMAHGRDDD